MKFKRLLSLLPAAAFTLSLISAAGAGAEYTFEWDAVYILDTFRVVTESGERGRILSRSPL